ncbi:MAG: serine--tRNA ligase, partial [bacterium]
MLDVRLLREEFDRLHAGLEKRKSTVDLERLRDLDQRRRSASNEADGLRQQRNAASKEIGQLLKAGKDAEAKKEEVRVIGDRIKILDDEIARRREEFDQLWMMVPNLPHDSTPIGEDERSNQVRGEWGVKREFSFQPKPHWEVGESLGMFDFERGTKISGAGFVAYTGWGARLERALVTLMIDLHTSRHGYKEILPPFLVTRKTLTGTGQLPKFEEDLYRCDVDDLFLIPTAEVPVTNLHSDEILGPMEIPIRYVAYSPCF